MRWREVPVGQDRSRVEPSHTNIFLLMVAWADVITKVQRARMRRSDRAMSAPGGCQRPTDRWRGALTEVTRGDRE